MISLKNLILIIAILLFSISLNAQIVIKVRPQEPKVKVVKKGKPPRPNMFWKKGHWKWENRKKEYIWVPGHWLKKRKGFIWGF